MTHYLEKRETPGREETVISLSGRQARVGSGGFRHNPHHSMGLILVSDIQELAQREGNAASLCSAPALWRITGTLSGTDSKHSRAAIFLKCLKIQQLAKGGTPGKTAIGGYLSVTFELTDPDSGEPGSRIKTGLAARPCELNRNHG